MDPASTSYAPYPEGHDQHDPVTGKKRPPAMLTLPCGVCGAPAPDHKHFGGREYMDNIKKWLSVLQLVAVIPAEHSSGVHPPWKTRKVFWNVNLDLAAAQWQERRGTAYHAGLGSAWALAWQRSLYRWEDNQQN
jgi:hypothetical protein